MRNLTLFGAVLLIIAVSLYIGVSRFSQAQAAPVTTAEAVPPASAEPSSEKPSAADKQSVSAQERQASQAKPVGNVPNIGSIQVLNGCGVGGVADRMADFLRTKNFDVKDIGNASSWNYPETMIISRTADMSLANEIEKSLKTGKVTLIRSNRDGDLYDVTVVVGHDYEKKIKNY